MKTKVVLGITVLINCILIHTYLVLDSKGSNWWSAIVLRDIVLTFTIFIQMLYEYKMWPYKTLKWREELAFNQRFTTSEDQSETFIRKNIQSMIEDIVKEGDEAIQDEARINQQLNIGNEEMPSIKQKKVMAIDSTILSATYVGLMKSNKKKYRLT